MNYKKILLLSTCFYFLNLSSPILGDEDFDLDELSTNLDSIDRSQLRSCEPGEAAIWIGFLEALHIPTIFDENFYISTALPAFRNPINFPNFFLFSYQEPAQEQLTFHLFWNQTNKRHYVKDEVKNCSRRCSNHTQNGKRLGSYLNIENGTFLNVINNGLSIIPADIDVFANLNFPSIFQILANAQLQERRLGGVFHYIKQINDSTTFEAKLPLFWQIRNLNYTEKEKGLLRTEFGKFYSSETGNTAFDEIQFAKDHIIMDAFGPGTLDLTLKKRVYEKSNKQIWAGASLYLPTDGHIARSLYAKNYFEPCDQQPLLHICDLVDINSLGDPNDDVLAHSASSIIENYFFSALHHLSSALLQCPMGYNKHLAIAAQVLPYWQINDSLEYSGAWIFEYVAPKSHPRFFIKKDSSTLFSNEFAALTDNEEKLSFIEHRLTERLFPRVYMTRVSPGFIFNSIANLQFHHKKWDFTLGYNAWYRSKEKLSHIKAPYRDLQELDIYKATTQSSSQIKLFGKIHRNIVSSYHHHNVSLSLYGNATIYNDNHGHDFTVGLSFDKVF